MFFNLNAKKYVQKIIVVIDNLVKTREKDQEEIDGIIKEATDGYELLSMKIKEWNKKKDQYDQVYEGGILVLQAQEETEEVKQQLELLQVAESSMVGELIKMGEEIDEIKNDVDKLERKRKDICEMAMKKYDKKLEGCDL